ADLGPVPNGQGTTLAEEAVFDDSIAVSMTISLHCFRLREPTLVVPLIKTHIRYMEWTATSAYLQVVACFLVLLVGGYCYTDPAPGYRLYHKMAYCSPSCLGHTSLQHRSLLGMRVALI